MPEQSITIKFKPIGDKSLINSINKLDRATKRLTGENKQLKKELNNTSKNTSILSTRNKRLTNTNQDLGFSFSTLRSKMLLFNFAMALGVRQVIDFGRQAAAVNLMRKSFNSLIDPIENSSQSLNKLRQATDGTVSDFRLLQQANNAMILGVSKNTDEMAEMFDMAQRLGKALGRDTASSVESLITGIGRQSRLMLDNIGIIVKVDDAQKDYAMSLNKSVGSLTDNEKKQAFQNAVMDAARRKVELLGDEQTSAIETFDRFSSSSQNAAVALGDFANLGLEPMLDLMSDFNETVTPQNLRIFASTVGVTSAAIVLYSNRIKIATVLNNAFTASLSKNPFGVAAISVSLLAASVMKLVGAFEDADNITDNLSGKTNTYIESLKKLTANQLLNERNTKLQEKAQLENSEAFKEASEHIKHYDDRIKTSQKTLLRSTTIGKDMSAQTDRQITKTRDLIDSLKETRDGTKGYNSEIFNQVNATKLSIEEIDKFIDMLGETGTTIENLISTNHKFDQMFLKTKEGRASAIEEMRQFVITNKGIIESEEQRLIVLKMLDDQLEKVHDTDKKVFNEKIAATRKFAQATTQLGEIIASSAGDDKKQALMGLRLAKAGIIADSSAGLARAFKEGGLAGAAAGFAVFVNLIAQIGRINAQIREVKKMETGGMVGGRRHSQGGTLIEAEQGEFVMSRSAVESVGIETMNRINQTGSAGVTVNVSGNVMSQDFVEGELAERIKEAVRKGSNFGMS